MFCLYPQLLCFSNQNIHITKEIKILENEIIDKECEILLFIKDNLICLFFGTKFNKINFDQ
jgi:hypothetical protein